MNVIDPTYEILEFPSDPLGSIERAARTCYKSEGRIGPGSAERLVKSLVRRGHHAMLEFGGWAVVRFVANRGFTHEVVRHRLTSLAQESSRYCDYSKGKFRSELTFINPDIELDARVRDPEVRMQARARILTSWNDAEGRYMELTSMGVAPEVAREVLPIGVKAEIVVGANLREWRHIFGLRAAKPAHPLMRHLMTKVLEDFMGRVPILFDDLV